MKRNYPCKFEEMILVEKKLLFCLFFFLQDTVTSLFLLPRSFSLFFFFWCLNNTCIAPKTVAPPAVFIGIDVCWQEKEEHAKKFFFLLRTFEQINFSVTVHNVRSVCLFCSILIPSFLREKKMEGVDKDNKSQNILNSKKVFGEAFSSSSSFQYSEYVTNPSVTYLVALRASCILTSIMPPTKLQLVT